VRWEARRMNLTTEQPNMRKYARCEWKCIYVYGLDLRGFRNLVGLTHIHKCIAADSGETTHLEMTLAVQKKLRIVTNLTTQLSYFKDRYNFRLLGIINI